MTTIPPIEVIQGSNTVFIAASPIVGTSPVYISSAEQDSGRIHILSSIASQISAQGIINVEGITQRYFRDNIKNFLPNEYWRQDSKTLAEGGGEGALEHLTQVFALSLDEIKQAIDKFVELFDIDHCPPQYLYTIARLLNYPLSEIDSVNTQRKQLREAIEWYRYKGARQSFEAMLYAFGFNATVVPLWTKDYQVFTETIPGISPGTPIPNDYSQLIENGGTWYRSPHFGIYLKSIIGGNIATINWGEVSDPQIKIDFEIRVAAMGYYAALYTPAEKETIDEVADTIEGVVTSASGTLNNTPILGGVEFTFIRGASPVIVTGSVDTPTILEVLGDVNTYGVLDYNTGIWSLTFDGTPPDDATDITVNYTYTYNVFDMLVREGAQIQYNFNTEDFNYIWQRIEYIRPVFEVLEWLGFMLDLDEYYSGPTPIFDFIVNPVLEDRGWYLGYCDLNDVIYTRLDPRLLGENYLSITSPLGASSGATPVVGETVYPESGTIPGAITYATGTLDHIWLHPGVAFYFTRGAATVTIEGVEGAAGLVVTSEDDDTTYGRINYLTGFWEILFEGVPPDNDTYITADYSYSTDIPPVDRSDALPRGATKLPFPLLRNPKEGYCYAPEELFVDVEHFHDDPYVLPLTRDGLNLYNDWVYGDPIDRSDFPSRGFTDLGGANHANTLTRATGESDRVLSVLTVEPPFSAFTTWATGVQEDWVVLKTDEPTIYDPWTFNSPSVGLTASTAAKWGAALHIYAAAGRSDYKILMDMSYLYQYGMTFFWGEDRKYRFNIDRENWADWKIYKDGVEVANGPESIPHNTRQDVELQVRSNGNFTARWANAGSALPGTPQISYTDTTFNSTVVDFAYINFGKAEYSDYFDSMLQNVLIHEFGIYT